MGYHKKIPWVVTAVDMLKKVERAGNWAIATNKANSFAEEENNGLLGEAFGC